MKSNKRDLTEDIVLETLDEDLKSKLSSIFYLDEFCEQITKHYPTAKPLIDETFDYLNQADICMTKKAALSFFKGIFEKLEEALKIPSEPEEGESEGEEDFSEMNDLDDGKEVEGNCEMCFSAKHLTLHHAIPKLILKRLKKKKKKAPVIYLKLCRQCHSHLHKTFPHAILGKKYYLIEAILECEELKDYIADKRRYVAQTEK